MTPKHPVAPDFRLSPIASHATLPSPTDHGNVQITGTVGTAGQNGPEQNNGTGKGNHR